MSIAIPMPAGWNRKVAIAYATLCGLVSALFIFVLMDSLGQVDRVPEAKRMVWAGLIALPIWSFGHFWPLAGPLMRRLRMGWLWYWAILNLVLNAVVIGSVVWHTLTSQDWPRAAAFLLMLLGTLVALWLSWVSEQNPPSGEGCVSTDVQRESVTT